MGIDEVRPYPQAFFASRLKLDRLRSDIYALGRQLDYPIWVSEHSQPGLRVQPEEAVQLACLRRAREAERFFCVLDGTYGMPWNASDVSLLELEIVTAAVAKKNIRIFLLEPFHEDPRLSTLLRAIRKARPESIHYRPLSEDRIKEEIARSLTENRDSRSQGLYNRLQQVWFRMKGMLSSEPVSYLDTRFLDGEFFPIRQNPPDKDYILNLIESYERNPNATDRFVSLWIAIRYLGRVPYDSPHFREFAPLWMAVMSRWASASAWSGLHGHFRLGRLAAVNTMIDIQSTVSMPSIFDYTESIQASRGALASEYYSIAKLLPSWRDRYQIRRRALWNVNVALESNPTDDSGLLLIKGSLLLSTGRIWDAINSYQQGLSTRELRKEDLGRIGEAESELGLALAFAGRIPAAERFLKSGVTKLEASNRPQFRARALRKLAQFYRMTLRPGKARDALERANIIAVDNDLKAG
ncbi:MAG TPA: hypothetical protein VGP73_03960 [Thermoanaerobaculia bacterium]